MRPLFLALAVVLVAACGDDGPAVLPEDARQIDATPPTDGGAAMADCFTDPHTHLEIINACTTAERIFKTSTPPLLLPDGGLPPLP